MKAPAPFGYHRVGQRPYCWRTPRQPLTHGGCWREWHMTGRYLRRAVGRPLAASRVL